jgi:hypothetical protein
MVDRCTVCSHPDTFEINRNLLAGAPLRALAAKHGLSPSALCRHKKHIDREREILLREQDRHHTDTVLDKLELLDIRLDRLFGASLDYHSLNVSLGCIRESLRLLALLDRLRLGRIAIQA